MSSVVPVAGGGQDYQYKLPNGGVEHEYVPPKGFDPVTASPATRARYGLAPFPPTNGGLQGLILWAQSLHHVTFGAPTPYFATSGTTTAPLSPVNRAGSGTSVKEGNWAGYGLCANKTNKFTNCAPDLFSAVAGVYQEPTYNPNACSGQSVNGTPVSPSTVIWAGIGGVNPPLSNGTPTTTLAQAGTSYQSGLGPDATWFEIVPGLPSITPFPYGQYQANPGNILESVVEYVGGTYYFQVYDANTGQTAYNSVSGYPFTGESAEVIVERTEITIGKVGYLTALAQFTAPIGMAAYGDGVAFSSFPPTNERYGIHMVERGTEQPLADPGDITAPNGEFLVTYANCGHVQALSSGP